MSSLAEGQHEGNPAGPRWALAAAALLWLVSVAGHQDGTDLARFLFTWARQPGAIHADGGLSGLQIFERTVIAMAAAAAIVALALALRRVRRSTIPWRAEAVRWALWAAMTLMAWRFFIVYTSELAHFAQYGLIGGLLAYGLSARRQPQRAFAIAFGLGLIDETWQHYGLQVWLADNPHHWFDWADPILNALGATAGILVIDAGREPKPDDKPDRIIIIAGSIGAVLLLPLLLLPPADHAALFGSYKYWPFWNEFENAKPVHWPVPAEGIPLLIGAFLLLGALLDPRRRPPSWGLLATLAVLVAVGVQIPRRGPVAVHEPVPVVRVPRATTPPTIDGYLVESEWLGAVSTGPFVDNMTGAQADGGTVAYLLWDDDALYVAFEAQDNDPWVRPAAPDSVMVAADEGVQILLDVGGDEATYHGFFVTQANTLRDESVSIPAAPVDYNPWRRYQGLLSWHHPAVRHAVAVSVPVDTVRSWGPTDREFGDGTSGDGTYTVEIAIPWHALKTTSTPGGVSLQRTVAPQVGERWRLGLYRAEMSRPPAAPLRARWLDRVPGTPLAGVGSSTLDSLVSTGAVPVDAQGRLDREALVRWLSRQLRRHEAWSPTLNTSFHDPARFGVIEFGGAAGR